MQSGAPLTIETVPPLLSSLRSIRALVAVSQHGSTVRAAEAIHISQPAVARAIVELERTCGLALFSRATRGMATALRKAWSHDASTWQNAYCRESRKRIRGP